MGAELSQDVTYVLLNPLNEDVREPFAERQCRFGAAANGERISNP